MRLEPSHYRARWWTMRPDGRIECHLCPRSCKLRNGQHGFCFVRERAGDHLELATYGRSTGFCVDPIEKKPLHHFLPGSSVLSFGTAGCNLGCRFCQNWDTNRSDGALELSQRGDPQTIGVTARHLHCRSVAFTYNDPVVFAEYALEVAVACRAEGVKTVAVTAGYIGPAARELFFAQMDAANVDLKGFTDDFYCRQCLGHLQPVIDTLVYLHLETPVWLEVTTLLIPGKNDSEAELDRMSDWFMGALGPDVPWHFSAYHPTARYDAPPTQLSTLLAARDMARRKGIRYVYTGNAYDPPGASTWCPGCGTLLVERVGHCVQRYALNGNRCRICGEKVPGVFDAGAGSWNGGSRQVLLPS